MKTNSTPKSPIQITSKWEHTNVITGATITLTTADARALYDLTATPTVDSKDWEQEMSEKGETCRTILRKIAKTILLTSGDKTDIDSLITSLSTSEAKSKVFGGGVIEQAM